MNDERDWAEIRPASMSTVGEAGLGMVRVTLLFGSLAIAVALFVAPLLDRTGDSHLASASRFMGIDNRATGTVGQPTSYRSGSEFTIRRSVLQTGPTSKCIIYSNGAQTGDC